MSADDKHTAIAKTVLAWFDKHESMRKCISSNEYTVLAGIVAENTLIGNQPNEKDKYSFTLLVAATGNKCIGCHQMDKNGYLLNDLHAEVLVCRALRRLLYTELNSILLHSNPSTLLEPTKEMGRYQLCSYLKLHLYISEAPCGDASLYPLTTIPLKDSKTCMNVSGAQPLDKARQENRFHPSLGILRTKSGRSDIPLAQRSISMSCSDKLFRWNYLGLQGGLLSHWVDEIFYSSIVISQDIRTTKEKMIQALNRCIVERIDNSSKKKQHEVSFYIVNCPFKHNRHEMDRRGLDKKACGISSHFNQYSKSTEMEILNGKTGLKQGASKKRKRNTQNEDIISIKTTSSLCRYQLFQCFLSIWLLQKKKTKEKNDQYDYSTLKQTVLSSSYSSSKKIFFKRFQLWKQKSTPDFPKKTFT